MSRARPLLLACLVAAVAVLPAPHSTSAQAPKARKVAFLVGVGKFKHLPNLDGVPQRDVNALEDLLKGHGFEVVKLTDEQAGKDAVEGRFKKLLGGDGDRAKALGRGDVLLVALCSHGFTFEVTGADGVKRNEPFVAGHDALPDKREDMIALNGLIDAAKDHGAAKLFLVDACREETDPNRGGNTRTIGIGGTRAVLPVNTAVLFSCKKGQLSHQPTALKHGLFTFAVLEALKGRTGLTGEVTWADLVGNVGKSFRSEEFSKYIPAGREQTPVSASGEGDDVTLLSLNPRAGDERSFEVADGVKMVFCWIPPGNATLGSPKDEKDRNDDEADREFECKGFWLGKYEVTQHEWVKVMGANPSAFAPTGSAEDYSKRAAGIDTKRFPVERVSWDDICGKDGKAGADTFLGKVNARPGSRTAFGKAGRFVLPHEDEWEYAARGPHKDRRPFYWGTELNGTQANMNGDKPHGTTINGPYLRHPTPVGTYAAKWPHPWGVCDMHGNVWEWCENMHNQSNDNRSVRGGSWFGSAIYCRAAYRGVVAPSGRDNNCGLRLGFRLD